MQNNTSLVGLVVDYDVDTVSFMTFGKIQHIITKSEIMSDNQNSGDLKFIFNENQRLFRIEPLNYYSTLASLNNYINQKGIWIRKKDTLYNDKILFILDGRLDVFYKEPNIDYFTIKRFSQSAQSEIMSIMGFYNTEMRNIPLKYGRIWRNTKSNRDLNNKEFAQNFIKSSKAIKKLKQECFIKFQPFVRNYKYTQY
ncbi:MAG: hypothetical protein LBL75_01975 [Rickettsiales bacterium]|jgi:hypothetical protein|nr:hypothetical protein [Rickettsiales bacterium]